MATPFLMAAGEGDPSVLETWHWSLPRFAGTAGATARVRADGTSTAMHRRTTDTGRTNDSRLRLRYGRGATAGRCAAAGRGRAACRRRRFVARPGGWHGSPAPGLPQTHSHSPAPRPTAFPTASNRPPPTAFTVPRNRSVTAAVLSPEPPLPFKQTADWRPSGRAIAGVRRKSVWVDPASVNNA